MSVITIPRILIEKFGDEVVEALVDVINKNESSADLATKADLANLKTELKTDIARLEGRIIGIEWKQKLYFLILLFVIIITNPRALDLIAKLPGIVK
jgi:hypothetical protein